MTSKKEFIQTARLIAKESEEVVKMARKVADACTDKRMKRVSYVISYTLSWEWLQFSGILFMTMLSTYSGHVVLVV